MVNRNLFTDVYLVKAFIGRFARVGGFDCVRTHSELQKSFFTRKIKTYEPLTGGYTKPLAGIK